MGLLIGNEIMRLVCTKIASDFLRTVLISTIIRNKTTCRGADRFVWRTMADSNRRHQASEACALSIWANGAYSFLRLLVYHNFFANASPFSKKLCRFGKIVCILLHSLAVFVVVCRRPPARPACFFAFFFRIADKKYLTSPFFCVILIP